MSFEIRQGDVLGRLRQISDASFDACLCDPPYGLKFMGKSWDHGVPGVDVWTEMLRVLKPGAFLLAFGGTRTHHRLMCAIEDAGFELRDVIMWIYGSGFPKSLDISKAIDKASGAEREVLSTGDPVKRMIPGADQDATGSWIKDNGRLFVPTETAPATEASKAFDGYGTALKPAYEPIIVAMKPCDGTFAENALKYGVAGMDINGSLIESGSRPWREARRNEESDESRNAYGKGLAGSKAVSDTTVGRWPANVILDAEAGEMLDQQSGELTSGNNPAKRSADKHRSVYQGWKGEQCLVRRPTDSGGASRFFYCAKASGAERDGNTHPTVKPVDLCRYLAKLILPPERGTPRRLIVPYSGSGSEMIGADTAGWDEITGIEREDKYIAIANSRLAQRMPLFA